MSELEKENYSNREIKITAAMYAARHGVVESVRASGRLPKSIPMGGAEIQLRYLIERRGTDITLTEDEKLVYDAILRERTLPGGSAHLIE